MKVLLDTSFLVSVVQNKIDLNMELRKFGRPEIFVLDLVINELKSLSDGRGVDARNAGIALQFLGREGIPVLRAGAGHTDTLLMEYAQKRGMSVCTIDRRLKDDLLAKGIEVITIRQNRYLVRTG